MFFYCHDSRCETMNNEPSSILPGLEPVASLDQSVCTTQQRSKKNKLQ